MLAPFPFLQAVTERDRRWPRVAAMAAATPAAVLLLSLLFAIVLGTLTGGAMFEGAGGPRLQRSAIYVLQLGLGLGSMGLAVLLAARYVFGRPVVTWLTAAPYFRWRLLLAGAALTVLGVGVLMTGDLLLNPGPLQMPIFDPSSSLALKGFYALAVVAGLLVAATAEEAVFRGYLLQQTAAFTRNVWVLIAVNAAAFALAHLEFDPGALAARALAGAALTVLGVGVLMFADWLMNPGEFQTPIFDPNSSLALKAFYALAVVIGLFVAATAEEAVFRGYLLQQTAAFTRNVWVLIAVNAAAFALAHLEFDPGALAARALAGAAFAWAALRLGGLEFAIGAHVATNLMIAFFQAPMLPDDPEVTGGLDETLIEVLLALYMVLVVELVRRSPRLMAPFGSTSSPA